LARAAIDLASSCGTTPEEESPSLWKVYSLMQKHATLINPKLGTFPFELSRQLVMEKLLGSKMINPNLPNYYFSHIEAKAQHALVQRLKTKLDYVKRV
jgi:hypothetical protein